MKARIVDPQVKVYADMDDAISIATLSRGEEIEFGGPKRRNGKVWVPVVLSTGQKAYIPGEARIFAVREGALMQDKVDMHEEATAESPVKQTLPRNAKMVILEVTKDGEQRWVRVRDEKGSEGYIDGETRIRVIQQKTKAMGRRNMISGLMWLTGGVVITFFRSSAFSGSSAFAVLGLGALLFGAVLLISGIVQMITAPA